MPNVLAGSGKTIEVEKIDEGHFRVGGVEREVSVTRLEEGFYSLIVDGRSYEVAVRDEKKGFTVEIGAHLIPLRFPDPLQREGVSGKGEVIGLAIVTSPMPGRVVGIKVDLGREVKEGEGVILVEAMKMENELHAPKAGRVKRIDVKVGDSVEAGQELVVIE